MSRTRTLVALAIAGLSLPLLAACAPEPATPGTGTIAAGCYDSVDVGAPDLKFSGVANVLNNLDIAWNWSTLAPSTDGTCTGAAAGAPYAFTLVTGDGQASADAACAGLGLTTASQLNTSYTSFPANAWVSDPPLD